METHKQDGRGWNRIPIRVHSRSGGVSNRNLPFDLPSESASCPDDLSVKEASDLITKLREVFGQSCHNRTLCSKPRFISFPSLLTKTLSRCKLGTIARKCRCGIAFAARRSSMGNFLTCERRQAVLVCPQCGRNLTCINRSGVRKRPRSTNLWRSSR
jgi:hypothetical protein